MTENRGMSQLARTHWRYTRAWMRAFLRWLGEARYFWTGVGVLAAAMILVNIAGASETWLRMTGLALQLLGIATVILGIRKTRMEFEHPDFLSAAASWLRRFPFYGTRTVSVTMAVSAGSASSVGRALVRAGAVDGSVEARLDALEKDVDNAHERISEAQVELDQAVRTQKTAIELEKTNRESADQSLRGMLESTQTGGLSLSAVGAAWLFVGVAFSTAAPELSRVLS